MPDDPLLAFVADLDNLLPRPAAADDPAGVLSGALLGVDDEPDYTVYAVQSLDNVPPSCGAAPPVVDGPDSPFLAFPAWTGSIDDPSFNQAMRGPDRDSWLAALLKELVMLQAMGTWDPELATLPPGRRALLCK